jgi:hypothetical protein
MRADLFTQRLSEPATMVLVGFGLVCLSGLIKQVRRNLDILHAQFLRIQHALNPLHVYCRLVDQGLSKKVSMILSKCYGILIYSWFSWCIVVAVKICRIGSA